MTEEQDSLSGRLKRYTQVSTALGRSALHFAGSQLFGYASDPKVQSQEIARALGRLKGPVMKVAQMLATIPDAVPPEYAQAFLHLQADAPSMGWPFVRRRMTQELGPDWLNRFKHFEPAASFAASLGQVHRAVSLENVPLACKLQYPDMASIVEADLQQLKLIFRLYETLNSALKMEEVLAEIRDRLYEELDYRHEAQNLKIYQNILKEIDTVRVPEVISTLSTERLLTMTWLEGKRVREIVDTPQSFRNQIAQTLFKVWYIPLYGYGFIHGDPHFGNYTFCEDGRINLLDFGCIRQFPASVVQGILDLYRGLQENRSDQLAFAYKNLGFESITKEIMEILNQWALLLYEPLLEDTVRPIQREGNGIQGRERAFQVHEDLKKVGGVKPPRFFVFLDRAAVGIGSAFLHLKAEANWHQLFEEIIQNFDANLLTDRQDKLKKLHS